MRSSAGGVAVLRGRRCRPPGQPARASAGTALCSSPSVAGFEKTDLLTAVREKIVQIGFV